MTTEEIIAYYNEHTGAKAVQELAKQLGKTYEETRRILLDNGVSLGKTPKHDPALRDEPEKPMTKEEAKKRNHEAKIEAKEKGYQDTIRQQLDEIRHYREEIATKDADISRLTGKVSQLEEIVRNAAEAPSQGDPEAAAKMVKYLRCIVNMALAIYGGEAE